MSRFYEEEIALALLFKYRSSKDLEDRNAIILYLQPMVDGVIQKNYRYLSDHGLELEDIKQESFFMLLRDLENFQFGKCRLLTYLTNNLGNRFKNVFKYRRKNWKGWDGSDLLELAEYYDAPDAYNNIEELVD